MLNCMITSFSAYMFIGTRMKARSFFLCCSELKNGKDHVVSFVVSLIIFLAHKKSFVTSVNNSLTCCNDHK